MGCDTHGITQVFEMHLEKNTQKLSKLARCQAQHEYHGGRTGSYIEPLSKLLSLITALHVERLPFGVTEFFSGSWRRVLA